jgi:hypothetical protein
MHLITQPVHVLPCSNSVMKGNNGTNRHCTTILLLKSSQNLIRLSLLEPDIPNCKLPWVFSERKTLPDVGNSVKEDSSACIMHTLSVVWCPGFMVVVPSFTHLSITFSNQRFSNCSSTADIVSVKLTSDGCLWKQGLQDEYSVLLQEFYDFSKQSFSVYDGPLCWCFRVCRHNLRNCRSRHT